MVKRYDYPTIDFSVQGWDIILNTLVEMLQNTIVTREVVVLGEDGIEPYDALYQNPVDGKWGKAQANGTLQPCFGLAVDTGGIDDSIRIHRMGMIENDGSLYPFTPWNWIDIGKPIYLDPDVAGTLTQTKPSENIQVVGYALTATKMITTIEFVRGIGQWNISRGGTVLNPTEAVNVIVWRAPFACTVAAVKGYRVGGDGATINARKNGTDKHLASDLSLEDEGEWMDGGAVQNEAYITGDKLEIMIVSVDGNPTQIAIQVDFEV